MEKEGKPNHQEIQHTETHAFKYWCKICEGYNNIILFFCRKVPQNIGLKLAISDGEILKTECYLLYIQIKLLGCWAAWISCFRMETHTQKKWWQSQSATCNCSTSLNEKWPWLTDFSPMTSSKIQNVSSMPVSGMWPKLAVKDKWFCSPHVNKKVCVLLIENMKHLSCQHLQCFNSFAL